MKFVDHDSGSIIEKVSDTGVEYQNVPLVNKNIVPQNILDLVIRTFFIKWNKANRKRFVAMIRASTYASNCEMVSILAINPSKGYKGWNKTGVWDS